jgi:hypothetical protein
MSVSNHFNNSSGENNIMTIDSSNSLNDDNNLNYIKNETFDIDEEDNLSQFSGFTYNRDYDNDNNNHDDILEQNLVSNELSDLDSELDFMFDYDIICNLESNNKNVSNDYLTSIKNKIIHKIKLNKTDLMHIQYSNEGTKFELIKLFNLSFQE